MQNEGVRSVGRPLFIGTVIVMTFGRPGHNIELSVSTMSKKNGGST